MEQSKWKLISLFLIGLSVCSCERMDFNILQSKSEKPDTGKQVILPKGATVSVLIEETISDVPVANEQGRVLNLLDKIFFHDQKVFLENKNKKSFQIIDLTGSEESDNVSGTEDIHFSTVCDTKSSDLNNKTKTRYKKVSFPTSKGSYVNIISLIPKELLLKKRVSFYCNFTFKIKNEVYSLLLQKIEMNVSNKKGYQVSLAKTAEGLGKITNKQTLSLNELKELRVYDELEEGVEIKRYDLFCDKSQVLSIDHNTKKSVLVFEDLMNDKTNQELVANRHKTQECVFHAMSNEDMVVGISPFFNIDFATIPRKKQKLDVSQINSIRKKKNKGVSDKFLRFFTFKNFNEIELTDYSTVDLILESTCFDSQYFIGSLSKKTSVPLRDKMNIMTFFPEELFFLLSLNYSEYLLKRHLIKKKALLKIDEISKLPIHPSLKDIKKKSNALYIKDKSFWTQSLIFLSNALYFTLHEWNNMETQQRRIVEYKESLIESSYELYEENIDREEKSKKTKLKRDKAKFQCSYSASLKDRENPENIKIFKDDMTHFYIKANLKNLGYKVKYIGEDSDSKKHIVFNSKDLKKWNEGFNVFQDTEYLEFRNKVYSENLYHLKKRSPVNLGSFQITSLKNEQWDQMSLKCYAESFESSYNESINNWNVIETHWDSKKVDTKSFVSLESILTDETFKGQLNQITDKDKDNLVTCRLFFYSMEENQEVVLRLFSPEMRFIY